MFAEWENILVPRLRFILFDWENNRFNTYLMLYVCFLFLSATNNILTMAIDYILFTRKSIDSPGGH